MPLVESVWIEIATPKNKKTILVGCIYKHPGANIDEFNGKRDETINYLTQTSTNCISLVI